MFEVDWVYEDLTPEMQTVFNQSLKHANQKLENVQLDNDDFIVFLMNLRDSRVEGGKTTGELTSLAAELFEVDWVYEDLTPEMQWFFDRCLEHKNHRAKEKGDDTLDRIGFINFLIKMLGGNSSGGETTQWLLKKARENVKLGNATKDEKQC